LIEVNESSKLRESEVNEETKNQSHDQILGSDIHTGNHSDSQIAKGPSGMSRTEIVRDYQGINNSEEINLGHETSNKELEAIISFD
jgi:hypothetical protein